MLEMAIDWPVSAEPGALVGATKRRHLVEAVSTSSGLDAVEIGKAVDALHLDRRRHHIGGFPVLEAGAARRTLGDPVNRRAARAHGPGRDLAPAPSRSPDPSPLNSSNYLNDGRAPLPKAQIGRVFRETIHQWRRLSEEAFEQEVTRAAREAGMKVRHTLTMEKATGVPLIGEVDDMGAEPPLAGAWSNRTV
ncbi:MAG: hypothetical protein M0005_18290 [Actinomycetota bacterium]|nr:hypothetical protein [Actinomycetota bacterium]